MSTNVPDLATRQKLLEEIKEKFTTQSQDSGKAFRQTSYAKIIEELADFIEAVNEVMDTKYGRLSIDRSDGPDNITFMLGGRDLYSLELRRALCDYKNRPVEEKLAEIRAIVLDQLCPPPSIKSSPKRITDEQAAEIMAKELARIGKSQKEPAPSAFD